MSGTASTPSHGAARIARERRRQITGEGRDDTHDDEHTDGELIAAAMAYLVAVSDPAHMAGAVHEWPWESESFKPHGDLRDLVKAGALIAAEIDRRLRASGFDPNWPPRSEYVLRSVDKRRPVPYLELDEAGQRVRSEVHHRHLRRAAEKLIVVPFQTVIKVKVPKELRRSKHDIKEWWLYPADAKRTLWYHPESVSSEDEAVPLGQCLMGIASVYASDPTYADLAEIPGQMLPPEPEPES